MICNCINNGNSSSNTAEIRAVAGNLLRLAIPLTVRTVEVIDGEAVYDDTDFVPSNAHPVVVEFSKGSQKLNFTATMMNGNVAYIEDKGAIPVGTYAITVTCMDDNDNPYRFKQSTVLSVVDATKDAGITSPAEFETTIWYLNAAIFLALKGEDGVGIADVITETSGDVGGENYITIVLTDGRQRTFSILNGSGSVDSAFSLYSNHPLPNNLITEKFNSVDAAIADLFGDVDYDSNTKVIRFWDKRKTKILATLNAAPFVADAVVNNVYLNNGSLIIAFNSDSGKNPITVPLYGISNLTNYYRKEDVNSLLANKANTSDLAGKIDRSELGNYAELDGVGEIKFINSAPLVLDEINSSYTSSSYDASYADTLEYTVRHCTDDKIRKYSMPIEGLDPFTGLPASDICVAEYYPSEYLIYYDKDTEKFYTHVLGTGMVEIEIEGTGGGGGTGTVTGVKVGSTTYEPTSGVVDISAAIPDVSGFATTSDVQTAVAGLVDSAPAALDTLNELAAALGDDANFATTITTALGNKADKSEMSVTAGTGANADKTTIQLKSGTSATVLTSHQDISGKVDTTRKINNKPLSSDITLSASDVGAVSSTGYVATDNNYTTNEKNKLAGIESGAEVNVQPDWNQTTTTSDDYIKNKPNLSTVATSGSYNDLSNKPSIPDAQVQSDWEASSGMGAILNKPTLATVATSGSYNDLSNKPTIPTKVSDLQNDSGFTTNTGTLTGVTFNGASATVSSGVAAITATIPSASSSTPAMDGTASAGSSTSWAKGDHVHPHDTSKADAATTYTKSEVDAAIAAIEQADSIVTSLDDVTIIDDNFTSTTTLAATSAREMREIYLNLKALYDNLAGIAFTGTKPTWTSVSVPTYTLTLGTLTDCTASYGGDTISSSASITEGSASILLTPTTDYAFSVISLTKTVGGDAVTFTRTDNNDGTVTITYLANVAVTLAATAISGYAVSPSSGSTNVSVSPANVLPNVDYSGTITADEHYTLPSSITVEIGGTELSSSNYTYTRASGNRSATLTIAKEYITDSIELSIAAVEDTKYTFAVGQSSELTNATAVASSANVYAGETGTVTVSPDTGYELSSVSYTVNGGESQTGTISGNGTCVISVANMSANTEVVVTASATQITYSVGLASGVTNINTTLVDDSSNTLTPASVPYGTHIIMTLTAASGYSITSLSATMGGTTLTSEVTQSGGVYTIEIASLVGNVEVSAVATKDFVTTKIQGGAISNLSAPTQGTGGTVTCSIKPTSLTTSTTAYKNPFVLKNGNVKVYIDGTLATRGTDYTLLVSGSEISTYTTSTATLSIPVTSSTESVDIVVVCAVKLYVDYVIVPRTTYMVNDTNRTNTMCAMGMALETTSEGLNGVISYTSYIADEKQGSKALGMMFQTKQNKFPNSTSAADTGNIGNSTNGIWIECSATYTPTINKRLVNNTAKFFRASFKVENITDCKVIYYPEATVSSNVITEAQGQTPITLFDGSDTDSYELVYPA